MMGTMSMPSAPLGGITLNQTQAMVGGVSILWGTPVGQIYNQAPWVRLLCDPWVFAGLPCLYLIAVIWGMHHMCTRPAIHPKRLVQLYNVVQIVVCSYMAWGLFPSIWNPLRLNTKFDEMSEWVVFVHYLSKYLDWFDTLFIIIRKRRQQLSLLHVYHHATIGMIWGWLSYTGNGNGTVGYGAFINSVTHIIMYSHYLWTSMGFKNPLKHCVTYWQIGQFWSCLLHANLTLLMETVVHRNIAWVQLMYQLTMIYLFTWKLHYVPPCVPDMTEGPVTVEDQKKK